MILTGKQCERLWLEAGFVRLKVAGVSERLATMYPGEGQVVNRTEGLVSQALLRKVLRARQSYMRVYYRRI